MNSQATSVTSLRLYQSAMAACFGFWRKISRKAFLELLQQNLPGAVKPSD
jgi:hypothetical protein